MNIVITGGTKGFGKSIAEKFAGDQQGHTILLCARNKEKLDEETKRLQGRFQRATIKSMTCDVGNREELNEFAKWILKENGAPDVLVNNAGTFIPGSVEVDIQGAMNAGMDQVYVNHLNIEAGIKPTYTVYSLKELEKIL